MILLKHHLFHSRIILLFVFLSVHLSLSSQKPSISVLLEKDHIRKGQETTAQVLVEGLNLLEPAELKSLILQLSIDDPEVAAFLTPFGLSDRIEVPVLKGPDGRSGFFAEIQGLLNGRFIVEASLLDKPGETLAESSGDCCCMTVTADAPVSCLICPEQDADPDQEEEPRSVREMLDALNELRNHFELEALSQEQRNEFSRLFRELAQAMKVLYKPFTQKNLADIKKFTRALNNILSYRQELLEGISDPKLDHYQNFDWLIYRIFKSLQDALENKSVDEFKFDQSNFTLTVDTNEDSRSNFRFAIKCFLFRTAGILLEVREDTEIKVSSDGYIQIEFTPGTSIIDFDNPLHYWWGIPGCPPDDLWIQTLALKGSELEVVGTYRKESNILVKYVIDAFEGTIRIYEKCPECVDWIYHSGRYLKDCEGDLKDNR